MLLLAFFGSLATVCQVSPCLGSLATHLETTSARFSYCNMLALSYVWRKEFIGAYVCAML